MTDALSSPLPLWERSPAGPPRMREEGGRRAHISPFPSPHSRSEWRGGVRDGGSFSIPRARKKAGDDAVVGTVTARLSARRARL
jgi:hypothetical protein